MANLAEITEINFQSNKINNIIETSNPIEKQKIMSVCMANQYVAKPLFSKEILSQIITNQHPVVLYWLIISLLLFCAMFVFGSLNL